MFEALAGECWGWRPFRYSRVPSLINNPSWGWGGLMQSSLCNIREVDGIFMGEHRRRAGILGRFGRDLQPSRDGLLPEPSSEAIAPLEEVAVEVDRRFQVTPGHHRS